MKTAMAMVVLMAAGTFGGCASHKAMLAPRAEFRNGLVSPEQARQLEEAMTDKDIARMLDVRVQAKLPASLAVARLQSHCSGYQPYLAPIDAEELTAWEGVVRGQREIVNVQPITGFQLRNQQVTLHALRTAAAELHCELLLVYLQADSQVDNMNDAAVLYWSIIGLWVVPGNLVEHKTVAQAVLLDCRTGQILGTATGDHHAKRLCPAAFTDQRQNELARESEEKALADLRTACKGLIARTVAAAVATQTNR